MKKIAAALAALASLGVANAAPVTFAGNGNTYLMLSGNWTYEDASATAAGILVNGVSGHVVTITSQAEYDFINTNFGTSREYWIGASDEANEGTFVWIEGPEAGQRLDDTFSAWLVGEPNDWTGSGVYANGEDHVLGAAFGTNMWNDAPSGFARALIVEFEAAAPVPVPAAALLFAPVLGFLARRKRG